MPFALRLCHGLQARDLRRQFGQLACTPPIPSILNDRLRDICGRGQFLAAQIVCLGLQPINQGLDLGQAYSRPIPPQGCQLFKVTKFSGGISSHLPFFSSSRANLMAAATAA
ncbi:hypothetical protein [Jannaschia pohangensis]|uniref:hypothetical protein n=1 Tax=Jannaschia pohangensis TaxID=390807 RepID=UPI001113EE09|nr:hypothetical protein [Jannaschia pohangensis]